MPDGDADTPVDWAEYVKTGEFRADLDECQRLVQEGDVDGLTAFASRDSKARAALATRRIRSDGHYFVTATVTAHVYAPNEGAAMQELCDRLHPGVVDARYEVNTLNAEAQ